MKSTPSPLAVTKSEHLPDSVYASVVRSLYADPATLLVGILSLTLAPIVLYWKIGDNVQLGLSVLFLVFGLYRLYLSKMFFEAVSESTERKEFEVWETRNILISAVYVTLMGIWFICSMTRTDDPFAGILSVSTSLCYMIGIIGRNFGSARLVLAQVLIACVFFGVGLAMSGGYYGGYYNALLAAFLVPFFMAVKIMSARLRNMLLSATMNAEENRIIAMQFDTALENVSHGVAMFDRDGVITVANDRFIELTDLRSSDAKGQNLKDLNISGDDFTEQILNSLGQQASHKFTFSLKGDRTIEADYNAMDGGGVVVLSDITERVISERAIRNLANFDPLTKLPNRRCFMAEIQRRLVNNGELRPCTMLFLDLDKFKEVNDALGHGIGDKLLKAAADRIQRILRPVDMVCRFGGDEFLIILPEEMDMRDCSRFCEDLIFEISKPFYIDNHDINISASIGISMAPRDGVEPDILLQRADVTLYHVKANSRGTFAYYSKDLGEAIQLKRELEKDLKEAIKLEELTVHFQPLINVSESRISTCEALVRWEHHTYGRIPPDRFVRIAEEANLIHELGEFVLRISMQECQKWPQDVSVAVNVSSIQFHRYDIYKTISDLLKETGLAAERLQIEVTESVMLDDVEEAAHTLSRISALGVKISLDDFGTGFSNLSYLHKLPFDKIKIDRSFIRDGITETRSFTLLKGVVSLIKSLGLEVVLEGIEEEDQMRQLVRYLDIDEVQGYLFSPPIPMYQITKLMTQGDESEVSTPKLLSA